MVKTGPSGWDSSSLFREMWFMGDCSCIEGTNYSLGNISGREEGCVTQQFTSRALVKEGGGADCVNTLWKTSLWVGYLPTCACSP